MRYDVVLNGKTVSSHSSMKRAMADFKLLKIVFDCDVLGQNVVCSINVRDIDISEVNEE